MGMGPPGNSGFLENSPVTLLSLLFQQHPDQSPIFGFWLGNVHDWQAGGQLTIGGVDPDHLKGPITWTPSLSPAAWIMSMNGVKLGDRLLASYPMGALIDTGSSLLIAPRSIYRDIVRFLGATPHPTRKGLHQGIWYHLTPAEYLMVGAELCILAIQPGDYTAGTDLDVWIMGDTFLRSHYVAFDMDTVSIGIALSK